MSLARVGDVPISIDVSGIAATWLLALTIVLVSRRVHPEWDATRALLFTIFALGSVVISVAIREALLAAAARGLGTRVSGNRHPHRFRRRACDRLDPRGSWDSFARRSS